jgi:hypothetical protein
MGHRHCASCGRTVGQTQGKPPFLAIARATEKIVVDSVGLCVVVVRIGDADEYSRFSLGDPSIESEIGKV